MKRVLFLFGELNDADVDWLIQNGTREQIPRGTLLVHQGQPTGALYIVLDGLFEVTVAGREQEGIAQLGTGEIVGELSFVDSRPPSTSVRALVDSVVYAIRRERLMTKLKLDPGMAARFYRALAMFLSHRLRRITLKMAQGTGDGAGGDSAAADELDGQVLDGVYLAGRRFERVLKHFSVAQQNDISSRG